MFFKEEPNPLGLQPDISLTPAEKSELWSGINAHMVLHPCEENVPANIDDLEVAQLFAAAQAHILTDQEKHDCFVSLQEQMDIAHFFSPATGFELGELEKQSIFSSMQARTQNECVDACIHQNAEARFDQNVDAFLHWFIPAMSVLFLCIGGAGISYASDSALPDEFLYPVKKISERIRLHFQTDSESKAHVETDHIRLRVKEAKELADAKRLTEEVSQVIDSEYTRERLEVIENIQKLEEEGKHPSAARLKARLRAYETLFRQVRESHRMNSDALEVSNSIITSSGISAQSASSFSSRASSFKALESLIPDLQVEKVTNAKFPSDVSSNISKNAVEDAEDSVEGLKQGVHDALKNRLK